MTLKGNFETFYIATILQLLGSDQKTGVLNIANDDKEVQIFFRKGVIIYARASYLKNQLGFLLKTNGVITQDQLNECLLVSKEKKQALGKVLCEKKFITKTQLREYIQKQAENIICDLFRWQEGHFEYKDVDLNLNNMKIVQLNTMELIMEATRRVDEMSLLVNQIPSDKMIFKLSGETTGADKEIKLDEAEWRLLAMLDGTSTVREIINKSGYNEFRVYKILNSLILARRIEESDTPNLHLLADETFSKIKDIDAKTLRNELDNLGLSRSSIIRHALARIFRNTAGPDDLLPAIVQEAASFKSPTDREALEALIARTRKSFLYNVIYLLLEMIKR